jgi:adenosine/AMP kinase
MMAYMEIKSIKIEPPSDVQFVLAQSHFIKTVRTFQSAYLIVFRALSLDVVFVKRVAHVW